MSFPVKLYVYDLSNGMARQLSRQLTGRQIDGIWHTSVVVFGREIFYGQGINTTAPGRSHANIGETALDEETFDEYLHEMKQHYTADKITDADTEFNCNSFTDDCVGFLTGQSIPAFIKDLPTDFLSTPFGAALRPTIDAMYRRPSPGAAPSIPSPSTAARASPNPQLAARVHRWCPNDRFADGPIHIITNPTSFNSFLKSHRAAVAFFTSETCPPCKMIEPVFERLSEEKGLHEGKNGAGFAKIDIDVGMGRNLASEWGIRATPTFIFFLDGKKLDELKGANQNELRNLVDLLLFQAYPPHPHTSIPMPAIQALSMNPIIFSQVPAIETVLAKLSSFIDDQPSWPEAATQTKAEVKAVISTTVLPYLRSRFPASNSPKVLPSATPAILTAWTQATSVMASALPVESLFPLVDMWRLAFLDPAVGAWAASLTPSSASDPVGVFLPKAISSQDTPTKGARNYILTVLRLLCNAFSSPVLARKLLREDMRQKITSVLVPSLLHTDPVVRTAAASLAFDVAAVIQKDRVESVRTGKGIRPGSEEDLADWQVEMVSALLEALDREKENEEVVHRLTAALAFYVRLSPHYETQIKPLLEVLQSRDVLKGKLAKGDGWNVDGGIGKKDIRKLVEEVAMKLCA
ncbi:PPPDE putative peptidase domain-containing protein [Flammula alnicola]|nr:PPPDE putative peptidase domain-containing protein [Flammula alnicola]